MKVIFIFKGARVTGVPCSKFKVSALPVAFGDRRLKPWQRQGSMTIILSVAEQF